MIKNVCKIIGCAYTIFLAFFNLKTYIELIGNIFGPKFFHLLTSVQSPFNRRRTIKDEYDYILIDNAPANDILTVNSMFASDMVLVPVRVEGFSHKGLQETLDTIIYIKEEHDLDHLKFGGTFITQAEKNTVIFKDLFESYESTLAEKFLKTAIRKDIKVCELESIFKPLLEYCPNSNVVFDYSKLILELNILDEDAASNLAHAINLV